MRRGIGCRMWVGTDMESASVWVERVDVDEVHIEVVGGTELYLTLDQAAALADLIRQSRAETWRRGR